MRLALYWSLNPRYGLQAAYQAEVVGPDGKIAIRPSSWDRIGTMWIIEMD